MNAIGLAVEIIRTAAPPWDRPTPSGEKPGSTARARSKLDRPGDGRDEF
jgi:hypothetical protein